MSAARRAILAALFCACSAAAQKPDSDILMQALRDEIQRSRGLQLESLEKPYYVSYALEDVENFSVSATLGALLSSRRERLRFPEIHVRVGDYSFDNTNYLASGYAFGSRYDLERFPLDNLYPVLRRYLWLATDSAYKSAVEAISRKRAALRNVELAEQLHDFAKSSPVRLIGAPRGAPFPQTAWSELVRLLSRRFARYPQLRDSSVELEAVEGARYLVTTEGTEERLPEALVSVRARAFAQAADGMPVRDAVSFHALDFDRLPPEAELSRGLIALAENVTALAKAPAGETYNGPVLFEGTAAAQLFAEVLGRSLALARRPVMDPGRGGAFPVSELEGRIGSRVLPEWIDVVDDPTQKQWRGRPLFGSYEADREGVRPQPLTLVEKGVLKTFLLTRQPVRGFEGSNGRARMSGSFGANTAGISNLFVRAGQTVPLAALKQKLVELCRARNKPYGMLVRKMDFPSSASFAELRRLVSASAQSESGPAVSLPILAYRVYPDGREELVRGLRFRGLTVRSLKDIVAAADDPTAFDFLNNPAPFAVMGGATFVAESCAIAPSVLLDDVDLRRTEEELPKPPVVPPPPVSAGTGG